MPIRATSTMPMTTTVTTTMSMTTTEGATTTEVLTTVLQVSELKCPYVMFLGYF